jgi:hypothetical protein|tara:strand:+ start:471 stop:731 length:261 start_codon:yes stop_codon:yes gene_type:complete
MAWGGKRNGAGRKAKADELQLLDKLSPLEDLFHVTLKKGLESGDYRYAQLFANYFYGKPRETQDITINQDTPLFEVVVKENEPSTN